MCVRVCILCIVCIVCVCVCMCLRARACVRFCIVYFVCMCMRALCLTPMDPSRQNHRGVCVCMCVFARVCVRVCMVYFVCMCMPNTYVSLQTEPWQRAIGPFANGPRRCYPTPRCPGSSGPGAGGAVGGCVGGGGGVIQNRTRARRDS